MICGYQELSIAINITVRSTDMVVIRDGPIPHRGNNIFQYDITSSKLNRELKYNMSVTINTGLESSTNSYPFSKFFCTHKQISWGFELYPCPIIGINDIQNTRVDSPQRGEIRVRGNFIDRTTATGVLLIVYSLDNDSDVHYLAVDKGSGQDFDVYVTGLTRTEYGVSVFAMGNGLPFLRAMTLPKNIRMHMASNQGTYIHYATCPKIIVDCLRQGEHMLIDQH